MKLGSLVAIQGPSDSHLAHRGSVAYTLCGRSLDPSSPESEDVTCRRCRSSGADRLRASWEELSVAADVLESLRGRVRFLESVLGLDAPENVHAQSSEANATRDGTTEGTAA